MFNSYRHQTEQPNSGTERVVNWARNLVFGALSLGLVATQSVASSALPMGFERPERVSDYEIVASFQVKGGKVVFLEEEGGISIIINGPKALFDLAREAETLVELFDLVAPPDVPIPQRIVEASTQRNNYSIVQNPSSSQSFLAVDEDTWADGCEADQFAQWSSAFGNWIDPIFIGGFVENINTGNLGSDPADLHYNYGKYDTIWFAVCMVAGNQADVYMERYKNNHYGPPNPGGAWVQLHSTAGVLYPGDRYLYHSTNYFTSRRRGTVSPFANAGFSGFHFFVSGAAKDVSDVGDNYAPIR